MEEYDRLAEEYLKRKKKGRGFNFFHFNIDLNQGPCVAKRLSGCGSGTEYLAVTPWGDLYPCHQFVGQEEFLLGNVDTGVTNERIRDEFKLCNVYAKDKCRDCFARFYCSSGCAPILIISMGALPMHMTSAAQCRRRESNAPSC